MSKRILLIDNDDSFTMNINQLIEELGYSAEILNYSELRGVVVKNFEKIIISPGPSHPKEYTK